MTTIKRSRFLTFFMIPTTNETHYILTTAKARKVIFDLSLPNDFFKKRLPSIKYIAFWDCDTGRNYMGYYFFALNEKHARNKSAKMGRYSDGFSLYDGSLRGWFHQTLNKYVRKGNEI